MIRRTTQGFTIKNDGTEKVKFSLDIREHSEIFEQGVFRLALDGPTIIGIRY